MARSAHAARFRDAKLYSKRKLPDPSLADLFERFAKTLLHRFFQGSLRRLVAVAIPLVVVAIAREQIGIARRRAEALDEVIEFDGLLRIRTQRPTQERRLIGQLDDRVPAYRKQAVFRLAAQPIAMPESVPFAVFRRLDHVKIVFCVNPQASRTVKASRM